MRPLLYISLGVAIFALSSIARSSERAMVLYSEGSLLPAVGAFDKLSVPATIELSADAKLEVAQFDRCEIADVIGPGKLIISDRFRFSGAGSLEVRVGQCAMRLRIDGLPREAAGVILRGRPEIGLSSRPSLLFDLNGSFDGLQLAIADKQENRTRLRIPMESKLLIWPDSGVALRPGGKYELQLFRNNTATHEPIEFVVAPTGGAAFLLIEMSKTTD